MLAPYWDDTEENGEATATLLSTVSLGVYLTLAVVLEFDNGPFLESGVGFPAENGVDTGTLRSALSLRGILLLDAELELDRDPLIASGVEFSAFELLTAGLSLETLASFDDICSGSSFLTIELGLISSTLNVTSGCRPGSVLILEASVIVISLLSTVVD